MKYKIKVPHIFIEFFDVEAENEDEAKNIVLEKLKESARKAEPFYEQTLNLETWPIITEDKYNEIISELESQNNDSK